MNERPYIAFGRRLEDLMRARGLNQTELAAAADVSISTPSKWIAGEVRPGTDALLRVATALDADYDELAELCGHLFNRDRTLIPGWDRLRDVDKEQVRRTVRLMAELNDAASANRGGDDSPPPATPPETGSGDQQEPQQHPNPEDQASA